MSIRTRDTFYGGTRYAMGRVRVMGIATPPETSVFRGYSLCVGYRSGTEAGLLLQTNQLKN